MLDLFLCHAEYLFRVGFCDERATVLLSGLRHGNAPTDLPAPSPATSKVPLPNNLYKASKIPFVLRVGIGDLGIAIMVILVAWNRDLSQLRFKLRTWQLQMQMKATVVCVDRTACSPAQVEDVTQQTRGAVPSLVVPNPRKETAEVTDSVSNGQALYFPCLSPPRILSHNPLRAVMKNVWREK